MLQGLNFCVNIKARFRQDKDYFNSTLAMESKCVANAMLSYLRQKTCYITIRKKIQKNSLNKALGTSDNKTEKAFVPNFCCNDELSSTMS